MQLVGCIDAGAGLHEQRNHRTPALTGRVMQRGATAHIAPIEVRARRDQHAHRFDRISVYGRVQRSAAGLGPGIDLRAALQEPCHGVRIRGHMQRRNTVNGGRVDVGALIEEVARYLPMPVHDGCVQRRKAARILRIDVPAVDDQLLNLIELSLLHRLEKRLPFAAAGTGEQHRQKDDTGQDSAHDAPGGV